VLVPRPRLQKRDYELDVPLPHPPNSIAMPAIQLHAVTHFYRDDRGARIPALNALDLQVADGEFLVILGPSGSGKTSLLRLIAGLEQATQGLLHFDGRQVNHVTAAERDVGMMFQTPALFPHLTVRNNLALPLRLRRVARPLIAEAVSDIARRLEIEPFLERRPGQLSGGEQQRVALGRALIRQPRILLLDEPLSSLDAPLRRILGALILRLHAELGITTLLVTHDPREVLDPTTRIAVLERGRITQTGTRETLRARPASPFVAALWADLPVASPV